MQHFRNHEEKDLSIAILTRTVEENKIYRLISEEKWIKTLQIGFPHRCNVKINLYSRYTISVNDHSSYFAASPLQFHLPVPLHALTSRLIASLS